MVKKIKTKDKSLKVSLYKDGDIEIESSKFKEVSILIRLLDPYHPTTPQGAIYKIDLYQGKDPIFPFEYDGAWIMSDGKIIKKGKEYAEYMAKTKKY